MKIPKTFAGLCLLALATSASAAYTFRVPAQGLAALPANSGSTATPITLSLPAASVTAGRQGVPYSYSLASLLQIGGDANPDLTAVSWSLVGAPPAGLSFDNGVLSGTPSQVTMPGTALQVQAAYKGQTTVQNYAVKVAPFDTLLVNMGSGGGVASTVDQAGHAVATGSTFVSSGTKVKYGTAAGTFTRFSDLSVPYSSDFQFDGDFTLELWANVSIVQGTWQLSDGSATGVGNVIAPFIGHGNPWSGAAAPSSSASNFDFGLEVGGNRLYFARRTGAGQTGKVSWFSNAVSFTYGTWHHYAVSRSGSTLYFAYDGAMVGTGTLAGPLNVSSSLPVSIGRTRGGDDQLYAWLTGYLQDVRVTKGYARYTSTYIPPAPMQLYE